MHVMNTSRAEELAAINPQDFKNRLPYLDWLRIIIVLMLIPFHTAMTFAPYPWFLQNNEFNLPLQGLIIAMDRFQMPLLFLVAGAAVFFSLGIRNWKSYSLERILRLVVPLVFGMLVLVPPCYWVAAVNIYGYEGSLWSYYPRFWATSLIPSATPGAFKSGTLWFLWYLILYTIVLSPLFILIKRKISMESLSRLSRPFENPLLILALFIPIAAVQIYSDNPVVGWVITRDFKVFYYAIFFIYGFFLFSAPGYIKGITRCGPAVTILGILMMIIFMLTVFPTLSSATLGTKFWSSIHVDPLIAGKYVVPAISTLCSWSCIIALLYLSIRFLNFSNRFVKYGNDAVLPYYITHATAITLVGIWIVSLPWGVWPKYILNVLLAFLATMLFYELMKRTNVTRFLMGMRLNKMPEVKPSQIKNLEVENG
ncbi:MAG: acyltransferase family protein [Dehalococcoidia bacterium]|nr:acyltransferase family protein [Dehalococcoidia bacterium]MDD5493245.1 acyltransferase family protein [Dehalococcoidia bacterium]